MTEFFALVLGISAGAAAYALLDKKDTREGFGNIPAQTTKNMPEIKIQNRYAANMMTIPPSWQATPPPRFSNLGYGAYINYNIPEEANLGVPRSPVINGGCGRGRGSCGMANASCQANASSIARQWDSQQYPLTIGGDVREGYAQSGQMSGMQGAIQDVQMANQAMAASQFAQDVGEGKFLVSGETLPADTQIYNYDRLVYAQKKSRLHGLGDPIRGDLPIVPIQDAWFRPAVSPNIDLRQGSVTTISGSDNATAQELRALQANYSGKTALAQKDISFDGRQSDVFVTAFP